MCESGHASLVNFQNLVVGDPFRFQLKFNPVVYVFELNRCAGWLKGNGLGWLYRRDGEFDGLIRSCGLFPVDLTSHLKTLSHL